MYPRRGGEGLKHVWATFGSRLTPFVVHLCSVLVRFGLVIFRALARLGPIRAPFSSFGPWTVRAPCRPFGPFVQHPFWVAGVANGLEAPETMAPARRANPRRPRNFKFHPKQLHWRPFCIYVVCPSPCFP
jgi:hypothetical protein